MNTSHKILSLLTGFLVFTFIISSCKQKNGDSTSVQIDDTLSFSSFNLQKTVHLFNDTAKPACSFKLNMIYPDKYYDKDKLADIQRLFIGAFLGEQYNGLSPKNAAEANMKDYITEYLKLEDEYKSEKLQGNESPVWMNYVSESKSSVLFNNEQFFCFETEAYTFTGGAHGLTAIIYQTIILDSGRMMTLNDLFDEADLNKVAKLLKEKLATDLGYTAINKLEEVGYDVDAIIPTENFSISKNGINWLYNQYEIAAYVVGQPQIFLSYAVLENYIKPDSPIRSLMQ